MAQPYDYTIRATNPAQNILAAVNVGQGIQQLKASQLATEQAKVGLEQQKRLQSDLATLHSNPNPAAVAQMMVKYPQLSEHFQRAYTALGTEQQKARLDQASEVYAALAADQGDFARDRLLSQAAAYKNSGMEKEAKSLTDMAELIKLSPETAKTSIGLFLASTMGPEKFTETFTKLEAERRERDLEPSKLTKSQAEAREAGTKADFAQSNAVADLQKKGWDIFKIQEDVKIAKENNRIAAMRAGIERETNDIKKQELEGKLADAQEKRDQSVRDHAAAIEQQRGTIDNSLSTIDRILANPSLNDVLGSLEGGWVGAAKNVLSDEAQNAIADIETVKSQTFLNQLIQLKNSSSTGASGLGALNKEEGERLINGIQSLSRKQGEGQFTANMKEIQRLMMKARKNLTAKFGLPETVPDTPNAAETSPEDIDALVQKYSGG